MSDASPFRTVDAWRVALGLLPVPLRDTVEKQDQYVLMNGSTGNFCLDFAGTSDSNTQRATAWSCDVGHYITCAGESVLVTPWGRDAAEEKYSCRSVVAQIHEFHRHLEKTAPDRSRSIIAHVLRVFRRIRSLEANGHRSLKVLLHLLAAAASGQDRISEADLELWGLASDTVEISSGITDATWRPLYRDLVGLGRYDILRPDFQLLLRHASGAVFQDAHLEAEISPNLWLEGLEEAALVNAKAVPSEAGIYFTPPALARTLAEEVTRSTNSVNDGPLFLFDPACGSGELLKECLRQLKIGRYTGTVHLVGWDKSPAAVDMARFVLAWEQRAWGARQVEVEIGQRDSVTAARWPDGVDILVMNPPFKSWQLMAPEEQSVVGQILGSSSKPNLAFAFAHRALTALSERGSLAMIAPTSLLEGDSGKDTREAMAAALNPQLVARLGDQSIFSRALVDAGMYVGRRKPAPVETAAVLWADSRHSSLNHALRALRRWRGAEAEPINGEGFSVYKRKDIAVTGDPWMARGYRAWSYHQLFQNSKKLVPANKVFDIRQGIRLGSDVFIVRKEYAQGLRKSERRFFRPAVMNPSLVDARLNDAYYAFYPYTAGLPPITTESELEECVPQYFRDHLLPSKAALKSRKTLKRQTELKWWDLLWPRAWQKERNPKIVSKYFGGRRSFAFDDSGDFVVVVGNAWILRDNGFELEVANEEAHQLTGWETYLAILTYLSSTVAYELLEYASIPVAGGQLDLSNKYIGELPVPNLASLGLTEIDELTTMGAQISDGSLDRWSDVDELVLSILSR